MPVVARKIPLRLAAFAALLALAPLSAADRYEAWLADGTKLTGPLIPAWPVPGSPYRFENQDLLTAKNPLRLMRDRTMPVTLQPPFLVLANGDILCGTPVGLEPDDSRRMPVPRVRVQLEPPLMPVVGTGVAVRSDRIVRFVATSEAARANPLPGTVVLADGRRLAARSIRWREGGLAILTSEGIALAAYEDLADVVLPDVDRTSAVLHDNLAAGSAAGALLCRFQMAGGSVVTTARVRREIETSRRRRQTTNVYYYVQPAWADQPLALPELQVAWCGCRRADEAPLSLFPAATLVNERLIGKVEPWLVNYGPEGGPLSAGGSESDLGVLAHAHSAIAFDLPAAARKLELAAGLDKSAAGGGCVRCKVVAANEHGRVLWDSGIMQGRDGLRRTGPLDMAGVSRAVLVTEFAHEGRPPGADPLDIRDQVAWLAPTVQLDLAQIVPAQRFAAVLPGLADWQLSGDDWKLVVLESRWSTTNRTWDVVAALPADAELQLNRKLDVTRDCDVLELLTACPRELSEHVFTLTVNGTDVDYANNDGRRELRERIQRYGRTQSRDDDDDLRYSDRLAYWWDLSRWRGQEVSLELTIRGTQAKNEIAWRGLASRAAIGNLPTGGEPLKPTVQLTLVEPVDSQVQRARRSALPNAIPVSNSRTGEPIRFLGQRFTGGYGLARNSNISFPLKSEYQKFVAVAGCCFQSAGPLQVLIDDRVVWERPLVSSLTPAEQIEIEIPGGSKKLTLQCGSDGFPYNSFAAWADAGFVTGP